ncbi:dentin sialophosphoprotein-like isoform X2 [Sitodiplosis mosellana]|uniref:dentin sialophosphoprotein-like isoform X2 n=1 Tax=Sitodiplosis mosellana TaxID=263140 RepID=UPI0024453400|nr:dentin sialophosphoprotein-like isoform X2 [Sitodiplosis mosellana]
MYTSNGQRTPEQQMKHYKMGRVLKSNSIAKNKKNTEIDEKTRENNEPTWKTRIHRVAIEFASTFIGQAMMMQSDKLLWTLEKTATWISNGKTDGKRAKAPASLVRPLNWFFFLPTLVALRFIRVMLSLVSICLGFDEIEASTMVTFLHESRRNIRQVLLEAKRNKHRSSAIDYAKQSALSFLSNLSNCISHMPPDATDKVHSNKTSLNASVTFATEKDDRITTNSEDSDLEDQLYEDFLKRPIETSDTDDEDFVFELNGDDISDTDSQSSVATEDLSDDDATDEEDTSEVITSVPKHTNGNAADNDSNYSAATGTIAHQSEEANLDSYDAQSSTMGNDVDAILNRLIEDAATATEAKGVPSHNRGKNINRHHKNGRNHAKTQNNGKHFNGAHAQAKSKNVKHHQVESTTDFIAEAAAADRT